MQKSNLYAGKSLGQNFLFDKGVARHIVEQAGIDCDTKVLEIGPGLGALTIPISGKTRSFVAVEKDARLIPILEQELADENISGVHILHQDILQTDIREIAKNDMLTIIGNIPYNISSQILFHLIQARDVLAKAVLMFQQELAQRIIAQPGTKHRSRLSVVAQYAAGVKHIMTIGPQCFFPRPGVSSTVLCFDFTRGNPFVPDMDPVVFAVIKAAFSKRRKSLKNAMTSRDLGLDAQTVSQILDRAEIDPQRRAETLSVEDFMEVARKTSEIQKESGWFPVLSK